MADIVMKTVSSEELMKMSFPNIEFCIEDLIPKGLTVLTGPLWSGKSCLALDLCWRVAGNTPIWDLEVTPGDAHYIFMDDTMDRVVNRAKRINEGMPKEGRKICYTKGEGHTMEQILEWLPRTLAQNPGTKFVVLDLAETLVYQPDQLWTNLYGLEVYRKLKLYAKQFDIAIMAVQRCENRALKQTGWQQPINGYSMVDNVLHLDWRSRCNRTATLTGSGTLLGYREWELELSPEKLRWELHDSSQL